MGNKRGTAQQESPNDAANETPKYITNNLGKYAGGSVIVRDFLGNTWRLGNLIGKGNFGEVYLASNNTTHPVDEENAKYVVKVEPHSSGPLFVEMLCLMNITMKFKEENSEKSREMKEKQEHSSTAVIQTPFYGIPNCIAAGSHNFHKKRYRFIVLQRFDRDLHSLVENHRVDQKSVLSLAIKIMNTLEALHDMGYCHNDLKAQNIMLAKSTGSNMEVQKCEQQQTVFQRMLTRSRAVSKEPLTSTRAKEEPTANALDEEQLFLIDFGLATKYMCNGVHRAFVMDDRRAHDGTLEFTSRDAHMGAHSRRSDLECLGYNLIFWSQGFLPWKTDAMNKKQEKVQDAKERLMGNVRKNLTVIYGERLPKYLGQFMHEVNQLSFHERPCYESYRRIFKKELQRLGHSYEKISLNSNEILHTRRPVQQEKDNNANVPVGKKNLRSAKTRLPQQEENKNHANDQTIRRVKGKKLRSAKGTNKGEHCLLDTAEDAEEIAHNRAVKEYEENKLIVQATSRRFEGKPTYAILERQKRQKTKKRPHDQKQKKEETSKKRR